jgi:hypothetical protein
MKVSTIRVQKYVLAALFAACAAGCGGGGDDTVAGAPAPAPAPGGAPAPSPAPAVGVAGTAEGLWREDSAGGSRYLLVESDGQLWGIPFAQSPFFVGASNTEAFKGNITASGGSASGTFKDVALLSCGTVYTCDIAGTSTASQLALTGQKKVSGAIVPGWTLTGKPDAGYATAANVSQIAGTWSMAALFPGNFFASGALSVTSAGVVSAASIGGCAFSGTAAPVAGKGYFKLSMNSVSGGCATGVTAGQVTGVAYQITAAGRAPVLNVEWHGANTNQFFWSSGSK